MGKKWKKDKGKVFELLQRDGYFCQFCKTNFSDNNPPTKDHIFCKSWGKIDNSINNLRLLCLPCNMRRGNRY